MSAKSKDSLARHPNGKTEGDALTDNQSRRLHLLVHGSVKLRSSQHALDPTASALLTELHLHYGMIDGLP